MARGFGFAIRIWARLLSGGGMGVAFMHILVLTGSNVGNLAGNATG
jgi:hypothetical protein